MIIRFISVIGPVVFGLNTSLAVPARKAIESDTAFIVEPPIGSETMAEMIMAAAEDRPTDFLPRRKEDLIPAGRNWIPVELVSGYDDRGGRMSDSIICELASAAGFADQSTPWDRLDVHSIGVYLSKKSGISADEYGLKEQMRIRRSVGKPLPYLAFSLPINPHERAHILTELKNIQNRLPHLNIILLSREYRTADYARLAGFAYLFPLEVTE